MSTLVIDAGGLIDQDPNDSRVYLSNWNTNNLPVGVELTDEGDFTITPNDGELVLSEATLVTGNRTVTFRVSGGRRGRKYRVAHKIVTNESSAQTKEQSFWIAIQDR